MEVEEEAKASAAQGGAVLGLAAQPGGEAPGWPLAVAGLEAAAGEQGRGGGGQGDREGGGGGEGIDGARDMQVRGWMDSAGSAWAGAHGGVLLSAPDGGGELAGSADPDGTLDAAAGEGAAEAADAAMAEPGDEFLVLQ